MEPLPFTRRLLMPVAFVFAAAAGSGVLYFGSRHIGDSPLHLPVATLFGTTYFLSIAFGPLVVFVVSRIRGASLIESTVGAYAVPFLWMTKEVIRLCESHPLVECLYWYVNPLHIWLVCLVAMELGAGTLWVRSRLRKRGADVRVLTTGPIALFCGSLFLVVALYAWGQGENIYVLFLEGYRYLFGAGV